MSESEIISKFKQGDRRAFDQLYDLCSGRLFGVCLRFVRNRAEAEDLLHDAFIKMFEKRETFRAEYAHFYPWARQITVNLVLKFLARRLNFTEGTDNLPDTSAEYEEIERNEEILDFVSDPENVLPLIASLPDGFRTVLNLYVFEDFTHAQISEQLGISVGTSKSQLARARVALRNRLFAVIPSSTHQDEKH